MPVKALAARSAPSVASVPELQKRTCSTEGTRAHSISASCTCSALAVPCAVPRPLLRGHRLEHGGMRVAVDERGEIVQQVEVLVAVGVPQARALAASDEERIRAGGRCRSACRRPASPAGPGRRAPATGGCGAGRRRALAPRAPRVGSYPHLSRGRSPIWAGADFRANWANRPAISSSSPCPGDIY